jgi:hypothetical protein
MKIRHPPLPSQRRDKEVPMDACRSILVHIDASKGCAARRAHELHGGTRAAILRSMTLPVLPAR